MAEPLIIGGLHVKPGQRTLIDIPIANLYTHTPVELPVHVLRGKRDGPRLFVCAAIHGDELNGIEIIRRLLASRKLRGLRGTLIAVPIVNVYGVLERSRYLPDRRDLNRSFPGSSKGSMAARLADVFMEEIVSKCSHGIDLHTGAIHRSNLPQIRANLDDEETRSLAEAFGVPVTINASIRDGSLRGAAAELGIPMLLYEAGEALRLDEVSIRAGLQGIINVMRKIGMLAPSRSTKRYNEPFVARSSNWERAPESGLLRSVAVLGRFVKKGEALGTIADPVTGSEVPVTTRYSGVVIGRTEMPLVHEGEAIFHIARFEESAKEITAQVEAFQSDHDPEETITL